MNTAWGDVPTADGGDPASALDTFASSSVVSLVFDRILHAVHDGRLLPGQRISDAELAEELGVSRTPVREAIQRLREIGIIEASANRFTRVAIVSPKQTADAMVVWTALYSALVNEVIERVPRETVAQMKADHERFVEKMVTLEMYPLATANADFFSHLVALSTNPALQRAINSVVHVIRLGSLHLPDYIDFRAVSQSQELLTAAARDHDRAAGTGALRMLGLISVPSDDVADDPAAVAADPAAVNSSRFTGGIRSATPAQHSTPGSPVATMFEQPNPNGKSGSAPLSPREPRRFRRKERS